MTLEIDDDCSVAWEKTLVPLATCNRCHQFICARRKLEDSIQASIIKLCRLKQQPPNNKLNEEMGLVHDDLESLTQRYADVVARYYHMVESIWDHDFVVQLIERPGKWEETLNAYRRAVYQHFKQINKTVKQTSGIP